MILLALLPVPPKLKNSRDSTVSAENNAVIHRVLATVLEGLSEAGKNGITLDCADGQRRHCFPVLCAWIADHMEHVLLQNIKNNSCPRCEVPPERLGEPLRGFDGPEAYPLRNHQRYQQLAKRYQDTGDTESIEKLVRKGIKALFNAFWTLPRVNPAELPKPDLLHTIYLGILKHLMEWVQDFLKKHDRLDYFDEAWSTMGAYPGFTVPKKAYRQVSQWQGKEMRNLGRIVLPAFTAALRTPTEAQRHPFRAATRCVAALIDFHLLAQYKTHTEATLQYMQNALDSFHQEKDIFQEFRVGKRAQKDIDTAIAELASKQAEEARTRQRLGESAAKRRKVTVKHREEIAVTRVDQAVEKAHFNFIKMHLLRHFGSTVQRFGSIPLFSTDISELAHKTQIKESYQCSNKNNAATQILDNYSRVHTFGMHVLNLKATALTATTTRELDEVLSNDKVNTHFPFPGVEPQPPTQKRIFRSPDKGPKDIREIGLVLGVPDLAACIHRYAQVNKLKGLFGSLDDLSGLPVKRFKVLQIPVPVFQDPDSFINHNLRCTSSESFCKGTSRNDPVWVNIGEEITRTGDLGGRLPGFLCGLLKLRERKTNIAHRVAVVELLWPMNGGNADPWDTLVRVQRKVYKSSVKGLWITNVRSIMGMAHLVPYGENRWLVNNRIDLKTWNDVYMGLGNAI